MDDKEYLKLAVEQAKKISRARGFSCWCCCCKNGQIVAEGVSLGFKLNDPTSHAETFSIREACKKLQTTDLTGATLYASLQPCLMCFSVANWAGISRIVFGCKKSEEMVKKNYYEGGTDIYQVNNENNKQIKIEYLPDFEQKMFELVKNWEEKNAK